MDASRVPSKPRFASELHGTRRSTVGEARAQQPIRASSRVKTLAAQAFGIAFTRTGVGNLCSIAAEDHGPGPFQGMSQERVGRAKRADGNARDLGILIMKQCSADI